MARREDDSDRIVRQATEAWERLKTDKSWTDWVAVGEGMMIGRQQAMHEAGTNQPKGKGFNMAFGKWLKDHELDDMDESDRAKLFKIMEHRGEVEQWRETLTLTQRMSLNHPSSVYRKWKGASVVGEEPKEKKQRRLVPQDTVVKLEERIVQLQKQIDELTERIKELEQENTGLQDRLDKAAKPSKPTPKGKERKTEPASKAETDPLTQLGDDFTRAVFGNQSKRPKARR